MTRLCGDALCGIALHSRLSSGIPPLRRHSTLDNPRLKTEEGRMKMLEDRRTRGIETANVGWGGFTRFSFTPQESGCSLLSFRSTQQHPRSHQDLREPTARLGDVDMSFLRDCVTSFLVYGCSFIAFTPLVLPLAWPFLLFWPLYSPLYSLSPFPLHSSGHDMCLWRV